MKMTQDEAVAIARTLPRATGVDARFVAAIVTMLGEGVAPDAATDWVLENEEHHALLLSGQRLVHVVATADQLVSATAHRLSDVVRVVVEDVPNPERWQGYEWGIRRWKVELDGGISFTILLERADGHQHDRTAELMERLMAPVASRVANSD